MTQYKEVFRKILKDRMNELKNDKNKMYSERDFEAMMDFAEFLDIFYAGPQIEELVRNDQNIL